MPLSSEERARQISGLRQSLESIAGADIRSFTRPELGQLSFEELQPAIAPMLDACRKLLDAPLSELPLPLLRQALEGVGQLITRLNELRNYDLHAISTANRNPVHERQQLLNNFDGAENHIWNHLGPAAAYLNALQHQHSASEVSAAASQVLADAAKASSEATKLKAELEAIVKASRDAAGGIGASRHATLFAAEATEHRTAATTWLRLTAGMAALSLIAVLSNLVLAYKLPLLSGAMVAQVAIAKVLLFSLLLSATVWCGRSYRAAKHNEVVNRHRQNALSSFEAFVEAASDEQTKNAVLLHASQSIFLPQHSGFAASDAEHQSPQVLELVRTIGGTSKA